MKKTTQTYGAAAALLFLFAPAPRAEVVIQDVGWQLALPVKKISVKKRDDRYHDIKRWLFPPSSNCKIRARAKVVLSNRKSKGESAVLLKYAFSARLRRIGKDEEGVWTVPFHVEERHVPRVKKRSTKEVRLPINRVALKEHLKRMYNAGYWPDAFKLQVMIEPRAGETFRNRVREDILPVIWETAASDKELDERP
ncbi:MAG: hypothetical protein ABIJ96_02410 [Elusimicrobiota bacterium]